ncbi:tetratricopeptide repeat protein [Halorhodospira sp. 9622]|uniref:tetratricopeptide repeat protein n=1 Tax=Halorhodospira sp. 9622 TaxID=2899136 RepID=UPI001EE9008A|nr:tetratricopeptide repeat protein [Halorhodospira sp. 9622]MCG5537912.1 tetratricopeptide repeat protein [Halorhodospira sp. 9622]
MPDPIEFSRGGRCPAFRRLRPGVALAVCALVVGCAGPQPDTDPPAEAPTAALAPEAEPWEPSPRDEAIRHVLAAEIAVRRDRLDQALSHYARAMAVSRDERVAERAVQLSFVLEEEGVAREAAERWRELAPERVEAHQLLGLLALRRGDETAAREELEKTIERWPGTAGQAFLQLGMLLGHGADAEAAARVLAELAEVHADVPEAHRVLAAAAERAGDDDKAVAAAARAFELAPADREAGATLLRVAFQAGHAGALETDDALAHLERVRETQPALTSRTALLEGHLLREAGRPEAALGAYQRGLEADGDDQDILYGRGLVRAETGDVDGAVEDLRRVLEADPGDAHAQNALGYTLVDAERDLAEARELIERALQQEPDNAAFLDSKGWLLYREGDPEAALDYLRRAFEKEPHGEIGAHLGEVLWELGEREQARQVWRRALDAERGRRVLERTLEDYEVDLDDE